MKTIDNYLLMERVAPGTAGKVNAPTFIYWVLYNRYPDAPMYSRGYDHEEVIYQGIGVDKHIPRESLDQLNSIEEIELRSSCEGSSEIRPTYLIIRLVDNKISKVQKFVKKINLFDDIVSNYDIGNENQPRIGITTKLWYQKNPQEFKKWWLSLPNKIVKIL